MPLRYRLSWKDRYLSSALGAFVETARAWIVPHERLLARVWGRDEPGDLDSLRVFIRRLRAKLRDDAAAPRYIETVRGVGYRLLAGDPGTYGRGDER